MRLRRVRSLSLVGCVVTAMAIADTVFAGSLAPILPSLSERSDPDWSIGALVAAHTVGSFVGAVIALVLSTRWSTRALIVWGLAVSIVGCTAFAVSGTQEHEPLMALARAAHGFGTAIAWVGALTWLVSSGSDGRRGSLLGVGVGALLLGGALGPILGWTAVTYGNLWPFLVLAVAKTVICLVAAATVPSVSSSGNPLVRLREVRHAGVAGAVVVYALPAISLGVLNVIGPLELAGGRRTASTIAAVFAIGAVSQSIASLVMGAWMDRQGVRRPVVVASALAAVAALLLTGGSYDVALPWLIVAALISFSLLMTPSLAVLTKHLDDLRVGAASGFALTVLLWSPGSLLGALGGAWLADAASRSAAFIVVAIGMSTAILIGACWGDESRPRAQSADA